MRTQLSMAIFLLTATVFSGFAAAEEQPQPSPLQSQLQKMQSGEAYGMKTVTSTPPAKPASPESQLNDNAKALANRAMAQNQPEPSRLEKMEAAYKMAEAPKPVTAHKEIDPENKSSETVSEKVTDDKDKTPIEKSVEKTEKAAADARRMRDAKMLYEGLNTDQPKKPPRLIPVD